MNSDEETNGVIPVGLQTLQKTTTTTTEGQSAEKPPVPLTEMKRDDLLQLSIRLQRDTISVLVNIGILLSHNASNPDDFTTHFRELNKKVSKYYTGFESK